jgi:hypothetical protein
MLGDGFQRKAVEFQDILKWAVFQLAGCGINPSARSSTRLTSAGEETKNLLRTSEHCCWK